MFSFELDCNSGKEIFESLPLSEQERYRQLARDYSLHIADTALNEMLKQDAYERSPLERGDSDLAFFYIRGQIEKELEKEILKAEEEYWATQN
jgi:hypothetical protein